LTLHALRRFIIGERLPTERAIHERLAKFLALPVFASDAISSSAYAVEEILIVLVAAGAIGLSYAWPVAVAIAVLFAIVAISYRQTVLAYPSGGGAYIVAHENLGVYAGLIAAAALLTDYVLTVAVSIASGVAAIISAFPGLAADRVILCVLAIGIITAVNLRGAKESGGLFAPPVYLFIGMVFSLVIVGAARTLFGGAQPALPAAPLPPAVQTVGLWLLVRAFASGCAALTGIEAISNGVQAFRPPESRNAATTLVWMAVICVVGLVGTTALAQAHHIVPAPAGHETVFSMLGRTVFGRGFLYFVLQASTAAILILAANTSFADFPRLSSILARDGFAPRQLANLGDRLVFSNGIVLLGLFSCLLVILFGGLTHLLIPLYAVGVFISFTLSQAGMVVHWRRLRTPHWHVKAVVNALGALATAVVLIVVASVKFMHGAWIIMLVVPAIVLAFSNIKAHYRSLAAALSAEGYTPPRAIRHAVIVLIPGIHKGVLTALRYAQSIAREPDEVEAVFVEIDPKETARLQQQWHDLSLGVPLTILKSPWRSLAEPVIRYTRTLRAEKKVEFVTVVLPEFVITHWWHRVLHNQSGLMLKLALMWEPGVVVTNVRYRPEHSEPQP
jgi:amino acid transporter